MTESVVELGIVGVWCMVSSWWSCACCVEVITEYKKSRESRVLVVLTQEVCA
jgi:hypothetical protein